MLADATSSHDDAALAAVLAAQAGQVLLELRAARPAGDGTAYDASLADAGDAAAQAMLMDQLTRLRPHDVVRSEEARDDPDRASADRVWIVDPLDGTREYSQGRADWAVHVALWTAEGLTGAVALPGEDLVLSSALPLPLPAREPGPLRLAVSRSHLSADVTAVVARLGAQPVPMGSAGVKVASVVRGLADAYVHTGGQFEWDSAAPVAVARAAGLHTSRADGSELVYNQTDPWLPDLVVCRPEVAEEVLAAVADVLGAGQSREVPSR